MKEVFRLRRMHFRLGLLGLPCSLAMLVASGVGLSSDVPQDRTIAFTVGLILFSTFMVSLFVWLILASYRESITFDDNQIQFNHVLGRRTIAVSDVLRAR